MPRFSVIIPTCHRNSTLALCLERLAPGRQTLATGEYEVIVTDDGATSTAEAMVRERFPWARWTEGPKRGPAANRNHGARNASAEWLAFTDDDCVPTAEWLGEFDRAREAGRTVLEGRTSSEVAHLGPFWVAPVNENGGKLWSCNFAIRRDAFWNVGGFDERFPAAHLEDVDFFRRLQGARWSPHFVPTARVVHPPRTVAPVAAQVRSYRSYFYFARKHRLSLAEAGLGLRAVVGSRYRAWRSSRNAAEAARFGMRCLGEIALLLPVCTWWILRGEHRPRSSEGGLH